MEFYGIHTTGSGAFLTKSNQVGSINTSNNIGIGQTSSTNARHIVYGIYNESTGIDTIQSNIISGLTVYGTLSIAVYGIAESSGADSSLITNNIISDINCPLDGLGDVYGINIESSNGLRITSNTIKEIDAIASICGINHDANAVGETVYIIDNTIGSAVAENIKSTRSMGEIRGIRVMQQGTYELNDNTIQNFNATNGSSKIYGIEAGGTGTYNVSGNIMNNFTRTTPTSGSATIAGIRFTSTNASSTIQKNRMTGFSTNSNSGGRIYGFYIEDAGTNIFINNLFVSTNGSNTNDCMIYGYWTESPAISEFYHNTFSIGGVNDGSENSACLYHYHGTWDKIVAVQNNIFENERTGGSRFHYAVYLAAVNNMTNDAGNMDYNYYAVPDASKMAYIGSDQSDVTFNSPSRGFGGTNSKYESGGGVGDNSDPITIDDDGYLEAADYISLGRGVDVPAVGDDLYGLTAYRAGLLAGYLGCTDSSSNNLLPIELLSFNAHYEQDHEEVLIDWVTGSELNNDYFDIQRKKDGGKWSSIDRLEGAGYSNSNLYYSAVDANPLGGISHYRLKQVDFDGGYNYSSVSSVTTGFMASLTGFTVYANEVGIHINLEDNKRSYYKLEIIAITGQIVHREMLNSNEGLNVYQIVKNLDRGMYQIVLSNQTEIYSKKLVIQH